VLENISSNRALQTLLLGQLILGGIPEILDNANPPIRAENLLPNPPSQNIRNVFIL
jgi:hypothetical protein